MTDINNGSMRSVWMGGRPSIEFVSNPHIAISHLVPRRPRRIVEDGWILTLGPAHVFPVYYSTGHRNHLGMSSILEKRKGSGRYVIGLTGGIAAGKSTVSKLLEARGATVVDADKIGHGVYLPGSECLKEVVETFGSSILREDGSLDRPALGAIVFNPAAPGNLQKLNAIVWPRIHEQIQKRLAEHESGALVVEAAVMIEAGWSNDKSQFDEVWVAWTDPDTAKTRIMSRNNLSAEDSLKRIRSQISNEERLKHADVAIENNGSSEDLERLVQTEWDRVAGHLSAPETGPKRSKNEDMSESVVAALLRYPAGELECRLNNAIAVEAIKKARSGLIFVFPDRLSEKSTHPLNAIKSYVGDFYIEVWDRMLAAGKPTLSCSIAIPFPNLGYQSTMDHLLSDSVSDLCYLEDAESQAIVDEVLKNRNHQVDHKTIRLHPLKENMKSILETDYVAFDDPKIELPQFEKVVLGGTFDFLHNGHKRLLTMATMICSQELTIGVTADAMLTKKSFASEMQPLKIRMDGVARFIRSLKPSLKLHIVQIDDPFGPSITDAAIDAIACSEETLKGCEKVNSIRLERGLPPLTIVLTKRGQAHTLSSTFIRKRRFENNGKRDSKM